MDTTKYTLKFDGASRSNPGWAGCGYEISIQTDYYLVQCKTGGKSLGKATNNVAEYEGLIMGLERLLDFPRGSWIDVCGDSALVVNQVNCVWKVKTPHLIPYWNRVMELKNKLNISSIKYIPREQNRVADAIASNYAVDVSLTGV